MYFTAISYLDCFRSSTCDYFSRFPLSFCLQIFRSHAIISSSLKQSASVDYLDLFDLSRSLSATRGNYSRLEEGLRDSSLHKLKRGQSAAYEWQCSFSRGPPTASRTNGKQVGGTLSSLLSSISSHLPSRPPSFTFAFSLPRVAPYTSRASENFADSCLLLPTSLFERMLLFPSSSPRLCS